MSLAFALFGAPNYPTEEASDDSWDAPLAQYNTDQPAHDNYDRHGTRLADTPTWRAKMGSNYPDDPPHKRLRSEVTLPPQKTVFSPLVPKQPSSPPPAHILSAGMYANSKLAENILRWISYAIRFGFHSLGIEVVNGWAHLHELAKAATSERKDFAGLTPGALRNIIELDVSGRWWLSGGRVCKVPRADRYPVSFPTPKEESMSVSWVSFG